MIVWFIEILLFRLVKRLMHQTAIISCLLLSCMKRQTPNCLRMKKTTTKSRWPSRLHHPQYPLQGHGPSVTCQQTRKAYWLPINSLRTKGRSFCSDTTICFCQNKGSAVRELSQIQFTPPPFWTLCSAKQRYLRSVRTELATSQACPCLNPSGVCSPSPAAAWFGTVAIILQNEQMITVSYLPLLCRASVIPDVGWQLTRALLCILPTFSAWSVVYVCKIQV